MPRKWEFTRGLTALTVVKLGPNRCKIVTVSVRKVQVYDHVIRKYVDQMQWREVSRRKKARYFLYGLDDGLGAATELAKRKASELKLEYIEGLFDGKPVLTVVDSLIAGLASLEG